MKKSARKKPSDARSERLNAAKRKTALSFQCVFQEKVVVVVLDFFVKMAEFLYFLKSLLAMSMNLWYTILNL